MMIAKGGREENSLHIVPIGDDAVLDRVLQRKNTALRLSLLAATTNDISVVVHRL
jgi:hypothetical protein